MRILLLYLVVLSIGIILVYFPLIIKLFIKKPEWLTYSGFYILSTGIILRNIYQPRIYLSSGGVDYLGQASFSGTEMWVRISQITTVFFFLFCILCITIGLFLRNSARERRGLIFLVTGLFLFVPLIISAMVSRNSDFDYGLFLFPLLMISFFIGPRLKYQGRYVVLNYSLLLFIYGSLLSLIIAPSWASSQYTNSMIGLDFRLSGVASHANSLGYISAASLMISTSAMRKKSNIFHAFSSLLTLVLSQSKTAWMAILLWVLYLIIISLIHHKKTISKIYLVFLAISSVAIILLVSQSNFLQSFLPSDIATLTGRSAAWQITMEIFRDHPFIGYGPNLWDLDFRQQIGSQYLWVGQAHNQFIHTLGSSGIFGLATLIVYLIYIIKNSTKEIPNSNYLPFSLIILLIARLTTETPLRNLLLDESFLLHGIVFLVLLNSYEPSPTNKYSQIKQLIHA